jgi:hypothetical protein
MKKLVALGAALLAEIASADGQGVNAFTEAAKEGGIDGGRGGINTLQSTFRFPTPRRNDP